MHNIDTSTMIKREKQQSCGNVVTVSAASGSEENWLPIDQILRNWEYKIWMDSVGTLTGLNREI